MMTAKWIVRGFALVGILLIGVPACARLTRPMVFEDRTVAAVTAPGGDAVATVQSTTGPTVWTTRVRLTPKGQAGWVIYEAKDSAFEPKLHWAGADTLVVDLGCQRFDYAANPDDWKRSDPDERHLKVRFRYPAACAPTAP